MIVIEWIEARDTPQAIHCPAAKRLADAWRREFEGSVTGVGSAETQCVHNACGSRVNARKRREEEEGAALDVASDG
jgi:hypothetical protein